MSPLIHRHDDQPAPRREPRAPLAGPMLRMTVYLGETDRYRHHPVFAEIVHRAQRAGLAGASVFRGIEGFGAGSLIHTARLLDLADDLPVAVVIIDEEQRIRDFLPQAEEVVTQGLITLDPVEVVAHRTGR
jgi:PII-like signaling protein